MGDAEQARAGLALATVRRSRALRATAAGWLASTPVPFQHLLALVGYWGIALVLFGPKVRGHLASRVLSSTPADASFFVWAFRWWPHALLHGMQPFYTHAVFAPTGFNLAWATATPLAGVLMAPVTLVFGPFVTFNVVALLAPATAAWTAYLLCRRITGSGPAAFAGGFFFGFSTYESLVVSAGHLNLSLVFVLPLCAYLFVRHLEGSLSDRAFVVLMAVAIVGQALVSTEVLATFTLVAVLTVLIGLLIARSDRGSLARTAVATVAAYVAAGVLLVPFLFVAFIDPVPTKTFVHATVAGAPHAGGIFEGFVFPAAITRFGHGVLFGDSVPKNGEYLGLPLVLILVLVAASRWKDVAVRTLTYAFGAIVVLSFGAHLRFGSVAVPLPWGVIARLPLMDRVVASRVIVFASLIASVGVAVWSAGAPRDGRSRGRWLRWGLVVLAGLAIVPNTGARIWTSTVSLPPFISTGAYHRYLTPGEIVVVVAPGRQQQMYWQADTDLYFGLAGGYMGGTPPDFVDAAFERRLASGSLSPRDGAALQRFVGEHDVGALLVAEGGFEEETLRQLVGPPVHVGGVFLFRIPSAWASGSSAEGVAP